MGEQWFELFILTDNINVIYPFVIKPFIIISDFINMGSKNMG